MKEDQGVGFQQVQPETQRMVPTKTVGERTEDQRNTEEKEDTGRPETLKERTEQPHPRERKGAKSLEADERPARELESRRHQGQQKPEGETLA